MKRVSLSECCTENCFVETVQAKTKNINNKIVDTFCNQEGMVVEENTWEATCFWFVELCGCQTDQLKL